MGTPPTYRRRAFLASWGLAATICDCTLPIHARRWASLRSSSSGVGGSRGGNDGSGVLAALTVAAVAPSPGESSVSWLVLAPLLLLVLRCWSEPAALPAAAAAEAAAAAAASAHGAGASAGHAAFTATSPPPL
jgi:hypothetical protein